MTLHLRLSFLEGKRRCSFVPHRALAVLLVVIMSLGIMSEGYSMRQEEQNAEQAQLNKWLNATLVSIAPDLQQQIPYGHLSSHFGWSWIDSLVAPAFQPPSHVLPVFLAQEERELKSDVFRMRYLVDDYDITISDVKTAIAFDIAHPDWIKREPSDDELHALARKLFVGGEAIKLSMDRGARKRGLAFQGVVELEGTKTPRALTTGIWDVQYPRVIFAFAKLPDAEPMAGVIGFGEMQNGPILWRGGKHYRDQRDSGFLKDREQKHRRMKE